MSEDAKHQMSRATRYHIITNPPPEAVSIIQSLRRLWPRRAGSTGISKNQIRGVIQHSGKSKVGATDDIVRCLSNGGIILSSLDGGSDSYYVDPVRSLEVIESLRGGAKAGLTELSPAWVGRRREELRSELVAARGKESLREAEMDDADQSFDRMASALEEDMLDLLKEMQEMSKD